MKNKWKKGWLLSASFTLMLGFLYLIYPNTLFDLFRFLSFGMMCFCAGANWVTEDKKETQESEGSR